MEDSSRAVRGKEKQIPLTNMLPRCAPDPNISSPYWIWKVKAKTTIEGKWFLKTTSPITSQMWQHLPSAGGRELHDVLRAFQRSIQPSSDGVMEAFGGLILSWIEPGVKSSYKMERGVCEASCPQEWPGSELP